MFCLELCLFKIINIHKAVNFEIQITGRSIKITYKFIHGKTNGFYLWNINLNKYAVMSGARNVPVKWGTNVFICHG